MIARGNSTSASGQMAPEFSLYLDLVRITAALFVLLSHTNIRVLSDSIIPMSTYGHSAVVVFFVLSGFVISHVTRSRRTSAKHYFINRAVRIYSVALPALLLTPLLDRIGGELNPQVYAGQTTHGLAWLRMITTTSLMNESWGLSIQAFSNSPFWSIAYEGWYYILFGLFIFLSGKARRWALLLAFVFCGPKILLLLPVWLMGVAVERFGALLRPAAGLVLFVVSGAAFVGFHALGLEEVLRGTVASLVGSEFQIERLTYAGGFLGDYLLGLIVAVNFAGFKAAASVAGRPLRAAAPVIRWSAGLTLSLYLFHRPLLLFFAALIHGSPKDPTFFAEVVALVLVSTVVLGYVTERQRDLYRSRAIALFDMCARQLRRLGAIRPNANAAGEML